MHRPSEVHPSTVLSPDAFRKVLDDANRLVTLAWDGSLPAVERLDHLVRGLSMLDAVNAGAELIGHTRSRLEVLAVTLRRAIDPGLVYPAPKVGEDEPYYA